MRTLDFKYLRAKNFMCFGPDGVELDLKTMGNIVLVRGRNLDVFPDGEDENTPGMSSNGSGKTSIIDAISYGLFGKTIKDPKEIGVDDVINNKIGKKLEVEIRFDDYRILRCRRPNSLKLWKSTEGVWDKTTEVTQGSMAATQERIEAAIGLSYETFVNVSVFNDTNSASFLESDGPTKRKIVENLLSLERFRKYLEIAKKKKSAVKEVARTLGVKFQESLDQLTRCEHRVRQAKEQQLAWKANIQYQISEAKQNIAKLAAKADVLRKSELASRYQQAQVRLAELDIEAADCRQKIERLAAMTDKQNADSAQIKNDHATAFWKINELDRSVKDLTKQIQQENGLIQGFRSSEGTKCPRCRGTITDQNHGDVVHECGNKIETATLEKSKAETALTDLKVSADDLAAQLAKFNSALAAISGKRQEIEIRMGSIRNEQSSLRAVPRPDSEVELLARVEAEIRSAELILSKKEEEAVGPSPVSGILETATKELQEMTDRKAKAAENLAKVEKVLPYLDFWVKGFGDGGIRKYVIDGVISPLNDRVAYWLAHLIDGRIKLTFDNEFKPLITRCPVDGDPFVYAAMSQGERRRLILTVGQAFGHLTALCFGAIPSVIFLDEVSTNIDPAGINGINRMIRELAKTRQVFVTTHHQELVELLSDAKQLLLVKKDGISKLSPGTLANS